MVNYEEQKNFKFKLVQESELLNLIKDKEFKILDAYLFLIFDEERLSYEDVLPKFTNQVDEGTYFTDSIGFEHDSEVHHFNFNTRMTNQSIPQRPAVTKAPI